MYFNVDMQGLRVVHVHHDRFTCHHLADIELPHVHVRTLEVQYPDDLSGFTDYELQKLYSNHTGQQAPGYFRPHVLRAVAGALLSLKETDADPAEARQQAFAAASLGKDRLQYVKGSSQPRIVPDLFELVAQQVAADAAAALAANLPAPTPAPEVLAAAPQPAAAPAPRAPRPTSTGPATRPAAGSTTGKVWDIADAWVTDECNTAATDKEMRRQVIAECVKAGINSSTASVQYSKWLSSRT